MSYYHPQSSPLLPYVRRMTIDLIRGYDTMKEELEDLVEVSPAKDGQPKGNSTGDPTFEAAVRRNMRSHGVDAIEGALLTIPPEYREVTLTWAKTGTALEYIKGSLYASRNTWSKYKEQLITETARRMGWHEDWR